MNALMQNIGSKYIGIPSNLSYKCSNEISVFNNSTAYEGATYIRGVCDGSIYLMWGNDEYVI